MQSSDSALVKHIGVTAITGGGGGGGVEEVGPGTYYLRMRHESHHKSWHVM